MKCLDAHVTYHKLCSPVSSFLLVSTCNAEVIVEPFTRFNCGWHARFANNYHFLLTSSYSLYVVLKYNFQYKRRTSVGHLKEEPVSGIWRKNQCQASEGRTSVGHLKEEPVSGIWRKDQCRASEGRTSVGHLKEEPVSGIWRKNQCRASEGRTSVGHLKEAWLLPLGNRKGTKHKTSLVTMVTKH